MTNVRETKRADELKPGDMIAAGQLVTGRPTEVIFVDTYPASPKKQETLVVHRPLGAEHLVPSTMGAGYHLTLATAEEVAAHREAGQRAKEIADIRALADWLEANPWVPMPYSVDASEHLDERHIGGPDAESAYAQVAELADRLGVRLDERLDDRTSLEVAFGKAAYKLLAWHPGGRPAEPAPDSAAVVAELRAAAKVGTAAAGLPDPAPEVVAAGMAALAGEVRAAQAEERGERVEVGADGCGCPITEELRPNDSSIDGTERVEHRAGCWNAPASAE